MYSLLFLTTLSFLLALILTPLVRNLANRHSIVDQPDQHRHLHARPIPRLGGVAVFLSYLLAFAIVFVTPLQAVHLIEDGIPLAIRLLPALLLIFAVGVYDDIRSTRPYIKFAFQIVAAAYVWSAGVHIIGFGGHPLPHYLSLPATVFWLVLTTNAINLIDGVDGLAAGVGLFATATILLAALLQSNMDLALTVAPLLGCLLGLLRYNFNPATIFLGDSGSLLIGFFLGCCSIIWSQKSATILGMTAPLIALCIPLLDTTIAIARRFLRRQPLFTGDRGHIHHRLLDRGLTPRKVALLVYALSALSAIFALLTMNENYQMLAIPVFCIAAWIGIQHLGYVEFGVAGRMFIEGAFRRHLNSNIALRGLEDRLKQTENADDCWKAVVESAQEFGFHSGQMVLCGRHYQFGAQTSDAGSWCIRIPLPHDDYIELCRQFESESQHAVLSPYVETLRRALSLRSPRQRAISAAV